MLLFWIAVMLFTWFRWKLLGPVFGPIRMHLFDALMWTCWAAYEFAMPATAGVGQTLQVICGTIFVVSAFLAGRRYLKLDEIARNADGKGKSDKGTTAGS